MKFKVFYAKEFNPLGGFRPPQTVKRDDYEQIALLVRDDTAPHTLETVFRDMNAVDGDEIPCKLHVRSMCSGDVVEDETGKVWFCGSIGWTEVAWE